MVKRKLNILLIEQDKIEINKLENAISKEVKNFNVILTYSAKEAITTLENSLPDIIILDLNFIDINGVDFLSVLKENKIFKAIPVIVITTLNNTKDIVACYKLGIAGYVLRPAKDDDYEIKIDTILKYWSLNEFIPY
jgi:DNA-binding NarL/FixJ family response regulator